MLALPSECMLNPAISHHLSATTLVQVPILPHVDYCSMLLTGLPAAALVCLWSIFNTADWMVFLKYKSAQIKNLQGLLFSLQVKSNSLTMAHKISSFFVPSCALWSRHTCVLAFQWTWQNTPAPVPLHLPALPPSRSLHNLPSFFFQVFIQMSPSWWDLC